MTVLVRLLQILVDGFASEADAAAALLGLTQRDTFVGGRVHAPGHAPHPAPRHPLAPGTWTVQAFLPVPREPLPGGAQQVPLTSAAFRMCGLDAGVIGVAWADELARHVTEMGTWTRTEADLEDDLSKLPSGVRVHVRSELVAKGISAPTEAQIDFCLDVARQRWVDRRLAGLALAQERQCKAAAEFPDPYPRTLERLALERAAWAAKHRDFKGVGADGVRRMLYLNPKTGATESWPVECLPTEELLRTAGAKAPRCALTLADLDLSAPHGEKPTLVLRGRAGGEVARAIVVAPEDRVSFRDDVDLVKRLTAAATIDELRAFIMAHGRVPAVDTTTRRVTKDDLAVHAYCIIMEAWWPEEPVDQLPEEGS